MTRIVSPRLWILAAGLLLAAAPAVAQQKPNTAERLLQQCQAYVSGNAEVMAQMTCENTIWSILKAMEASKSDRFELQGALLQAPGPRALGRAGSPDLRRIRQHPPRAATLSRRARRAAGPPKRLSLRG